MNVHLNPGTHVRLRGDVVGVTLRSPDGRVVRPDVYDGYVVVHLDTPALFQHADGTSEELAEIVEAIDNLIILERTANQKEGERDRCRSV